jgi:hypothetical protein
VKIFLKHPIGGLTPLVSVMEQTVMNILFSSFALLRFKAVFL